MTLVIQLAKTPVRLADRLRLDERGHWARVGFALATQYVGMAGPRDGTAAGGRGALALHGLPCAADDGPATVRDDGGGRRPGH